MTRAITHAFLLSLALAALAGAADPAEWRSYNGDPGGARFSPLAQINRANVARLKRAWTYRTGDLELGLADMEKGRAPAFECTPLVVDGVLYLSTPSSRIIALDAETGREIWKFDPFAGGSGKRKFEAHRGVAYWEGPSASGDKLDRRILYGTLDGRLIALDAATGKPIAHFGTNGAVDLRRGAADDFPNAEYSVSSPPAIYKDLVILGARLQESPSRGPSGMVRAFDVRSGELVWKFRTVPPPGEAGNETWDGDSWKQRSGVNAWGALSVDPERGVVYLPLGSPTYDFYGADRKGANLFGNSVVALEASTGRRLWHFQTVHHDLWDYDLPAAPVLFTMRREGRDIPALAQVTKTGFVFVLNRVTGEPLFPVEERPVPASPVPGEASAPTQPFPLKPPALARQQPLTREELARVTPESAKFCEELFDSLVSGGLFTPLGTRPTLVFPGTLGGGTWSGGSYDAAGGYLYVNTNNVGTHGAMKPQPPGSPLAYRRGSPWGEYARFWDAQRRPCQKPPWGLLTAVDVSKGEIAWQMPLGGNDELAAKGITGTGAPNLGGSIVTAGGLVFIAGTNDERFRAFDARSGKLLWETRLEASGHATPVTYRGKRSGKQYLVIAAGGGGYFSLKVSDALVAFTLP